MRSVLVYADGRVEELKEPLVGMYHFVTDVPRCPSCGHRVGPAVERKFRVHLATSADDGGTMVGIEESAKEKP